MNIWLHYFLNVTYLVTVVLDISCMSCSYFSSFRIWYYLIELSQSQSADDLYLAMWMKSYKIHKPRSEWLWKVRLGREKWEANFRGESEWREANSGHQQGLAGPLEIKEKDPSILEARCTPMEIPSVLGFLRKNKHECKKLWSPWVLMLDRSHTRTRITVQSSVLNSNRSVSLEYLTQCPGHRLLGIAMSIPQFVSF